jgi:hypothetical protein
MQQQLSGLSPAALAPIKPAAPARLRVLTPAAADGFVCAGPHDVYHRPGYVEACVGFDGGAPVYLLYESDAGAVYAPMLKRTIDRLAPELSDLSSPYGYPGPLVRPADGADPHALLSDALDAICVWLGETGLVSAVMRAHPTYTPLGAGLFADGRGFHHGDLVVMNLTDGMDGLRAELRPRYRSYLNRQEREGVTVEEDPTFAELDAWVDIYHQSMRRLNAVDSYFFDAAYFRALRVALGRQVRLYFARLNGQIIAGGVFFVCGQHAVWHLNATHDDWMAYAPSKSVIWNVAQMLMAEGVETINIGSGLGARRDALFQFKAGFSKRTAPFCTLRLIGDTAAYDRLNERWRAAAIPGADPGNMFPLYRATTRMVTAPLD